MTVTQSSWKQIIEARQGFDFPRHHVVVTPKGCVTLSFANKILVRDGEDVPKLLDSDKVKINEECCCPPIEFNLIMGEVDINRPGISRPSFGRFIWVTNVPTYGTVQFRLSGSTTGWPYSISGTIEERYHEYFGETIIPEQDYQFRILAFRDFCGDGATSPIYTFTTCAGELYLDSPNLANLQVIREVLPYVGTTLVYSPFQASASTGIPGLLYAIPSPTTEVETLSMVTTPVVTLTETYFFVTAEITTVP